MLQATQCVACSISRTAEGMRVRFPSVFAVLVSCSMNSLCVGLINFFEQFVDEGDLGNGYTVLKRAYTPQTMLQAT